jgi:uncharacterized protein YcfJ
MQKKIIATAILVAVSIQSRADDFTDTAKVISSRPIYQTVAGQECYNVPVRTQSSGSRSMGGSILGGIAGALLGSQVGQGSGRVAAGAAGAIAGAITGYRMTAAIAAARACSRNARTCQNRSFPGMRYIICMADMRA